MTYPPPGQPVPPPGQPYPPPLYGPGAGAQRKGSGFAVTSLVLGVLGCLLGLIPFVGFVSFPLGVVGIIFGIVGLSGNREGKGMAVAGTILSVIALALAVVGVIIIGAIVSGADDAVDNALGDNTSQVLDRELDVQIGQFVEDGNDIVQNGKLQVTLRNKGDETRSFTVTIDAQDAQGNRIEDDILFANDLAAGQSTTKDAFTLTSSDKVDALRSAKFVVAKATAF